MQKFKVNGQSVSKIEWKQTDAQTDGGDCITSLANALDNKANVDIRSLAVPRIRTTSGDRSFAVAGQRATDD